MNPIMRGGMVELDCGTLHDWQKIREENEHLRAEVVELRRREKGREWLADNYGEIDATHDGDFWKVFVVRKGGGVDLVGVFESKSEADDCRIRLAIARAEAEEAGKEGA